MNSGQPMLLESDERRIHFNLFYEPNGNRSLRLMQHRWRMSLEQTLWRNSLHTLCTHGFACVDVCTHTCTQESTRVHTHTYTHWWQKQDFCCWAWLCSDRTHVTFTWTNPQMSSNGCQVIIFFCLQNISQTWYILPIPIPILHPNYHNSLIIPFCLPFTPSP